MASDDESGKLHFYPWPELLNRPRRELLVPNLLFTTGVTTLVAPSGEGKTTLALSVAMTVETGGTWDGEIIKPRPVVWAAGEGLDDLRPMYEAWHQANPNCPVPQGCFLEEAIDFSSESETDKLIKSLEGMPPTLIVTDALADMIGELSESDSRDMTRVYRNIWRVVRANTGSFLIPHHAGWNTERERGSTAIRAKSDIVAQVIEFDPVAGFIKLKHHKRRGGTKLKEFSYEVKMVTVTGYPEPIPFVTGVNKAGADFLTTNLTEMETHARALVRIMLEHCPEGARSRDLENLSKMSKSTYNRARGWAVGEGWLVGGQGRGLRYKLNSNQSWKAAVSSPYISLVPSTSDPSVPPSIPSVPLSVPSTSLRQGCGLDGTDTDVNRNLVGTDTNIPIPPPVGAGPIDPLAEAAELLKKELSAEELKWGPKLPPNKLADAAYRAVGKPKG